jgi:DNA polymerase-3 subunit gamma/tau
MSYQVLARKWRPRRFADVVGQQHVLRALCNALDNDRLHHAYLFTGTRGVGKTTLARIFAKCLNCETGVSSQACGQCSSCKELDDGRFVDLIEVDAASRTKVDETRELLENVQYAPTKGRYKVYLIDEVHMFSNHSFNALLKTLEEPPPHVKFLLATTDPRRIPITILSRCLQFNLKRLTADEIGGHLDKVLVAEVIEYEQNAVRRMARAADGSIRDALSLLDQAIAHGGGKVVDAEVASMLGDIGSGAATELLETIIAGDGQALFERLAEHASLSPDYEQLLNELLRLLQQVAIRQLVPAAPVTEQWDIDVLKKLADGVSPELCQLFYQIGVTGRRDLALAPDARIGFEMSLLRMLAFRREAGAERPQPDKPAAEDRGASRAPGAAMAPDPDLDKAERRQDRKWADLVPQLGLQGLALEFADNCVLVSDAKNTFELAVAPHLQQLRNNRAEEQLRRALGKLRNESVQVKVVVAEAEGDSPAALRQRRERRRQQQARQSVAGDPQVNVLLDAFDARLDEVTAKPQD